MEGEEENEEEPGDRGSASPEEQVNISGKGTGESSSSVAVIQGVLQPMATATSSTNVPTENKPRFVDRWLDNGHTWHGERVVRRAVQRGGEEELLTLIKRWVVPYQTVFTLPYSHADEKEDGREMEGASTTLGMGIARTPSWTSFWLINPGRSGCCSCCYYALPRPEYLDLPPWTCISWIYVVH